MKDKVVQFRMAKAEYLMVKRLAEQKNHDSLAAYLRALIRADRDRVGGG